jgi:acyl carrier protein
MTHADIVRTVKDYILRTQLQGEDPSRLTPTTPLITGGILDSLATLELVSFLEQQYGIEFQAHEVDTEYLGTLEAIAGLVSNKVAAKA